MATSARFKGKEKPSREKQISNIASRNLPAAVKQGYVGRLVESKLGWRAVKKKSYRRLLQSVNEGSREASEPPIDTVI